ncbi:MAG: methyltransferase, partial [Planctomycetota bacterium]
ASCDVVEFVIDINPDKAGKYVSGTGHRIIHPDELRTVIPGTILVSNPNYLSDIQSTLGDLQLNCEVVCI